MGGFLLEFADYLDTWARRNEEEEEVQWEFSTWL